MKIFIQFGVFSILVTAQVHASTVILKDGQTITGNIIQQDKTKVVIENEGTSLTYYSDEIRSIESDAEKEKLIDQLLKLIPTSRIVSEWVESNKIKPASKKKYILLSLEDGQNIQALTKLRKKGLMQYFSTRDLKAAVNFYSSDEGKQYLKDNRKFQIITMSEFYHKIVSSGNNTAAAYRRSLQNKHP